MPEEAGAVWRERPLEDMAQENHHQLPLPKKLATLLAVSARKPAVLDAAMEASSAQSPDIDALLTDI